MKNNKMTKDDKWFIIKEITKEVIQHLIVGLIGWIGFIGFLLTGLFLYFAVYG